MSRLHKLCFEIWDDEVIQSLFSGNIFSLKFRAVILLFFCFLVQNVLSGNTFSLIFNILYT